MYFHVGSYGYECVTLLHCLFLGEKHFKTFMALGGNDSSASTIVWNNEALGDDVVRSMSINRLHRSLYTTHRIVGTTNDFARTGTDAAPFHTALC